MYIVLLITLFWAMSSVVATPVSDSTFLVEKVTPSVVTPEVSDSSLGDLYALFGEEVPEEIPHVASPEVVISEVTDSAVSSAQEQKIDSVPLIEHATAGEVPTTLTVNTDLESGKITCLFPPCDTESILEITTLSGSVLLSENVAEQTTAIHLPAEQIDSGTYILRLLTGGSAQNVIARAVSIIR